MALIPRSWVSAPGYAMPQAIKRAGLKLADMDVMECNEAFAVQNLAVIKEVEKQTGEKVNMDNWGIPAVILYKFLCDKGTVGEKVGFYNILFIASPGITQSKAGTLISELFKFKELFDRNAPLKKVFPGSCRRIS